MEKPTLSQVKRDPEFYKIDRGAMRSVLEDLDPEYLGLPEEEKNDVVNSLHNNMPEKYISGTEMFEPDPPVSTYKFDMEYEMGIGDLVADIAPPVAATIGGITGFGAGAGLSSYPLSVGGAGLGGMAGEAYKTIWYGATGRGEIPESTLGYAKRIGKTGLEEMAWESIGLAIGLPIRAIRGAKNIIGKTARKTSTEYGQLSPGETMDEGWLRTVIENIENIGSLGKHKLDKARKLGIVKRAVQNRIGLHMTKRESLQPLLYDSLTDESNAWRELCQSSYGELNKYLTKLAGKTARSDKFISTSFLKSRAQNLLNFSERLGIGDESIKELNRVLQMEDFVSFRSAKLQWGRMSVDKKLVEMNVGFKEDVGKQIKRFDESGLAGDLWDSSDTLYKEGKDLFNKEIAKEILRDLPEERMHDYLVRPNNGENLNKIKKLLLGEYELSLRADALSPSAFHGVFRKQWRKLQSVTYDKLLENSTLPNGVLSGKLLKQETRRLGTTADVIFEPFPEIPKNLFNKKKNIIGFTEHLIKLEPKTKLLNLATITLAAPAVGVGAATVIGGEDIGIGEVEKVVMVSGGIILSSVALRRLVGSKTGYKIMKEISRTPARAIEKLTTLTLRANNFLDRIERRESWLEKRGKDMLKQGMEGRRAPTSAAPATSTTPAIPVVPPKRAESPTHKAGRTEIIKQLFE